MAQRPTMNGFLAWSLLSAVALVVVLLASLPAVARALFTADPGVEEVGEKFSLLIADHEDVMSTYRDRFDGRSIFFKPRQPRRESAPPPPPPEREVVEKPKTDPEPPKPKPKPPYAGPAVTGIVGEKVFFNDRRAAVGEPAVDNLEVLSVDAPWSVRVRFRDWEYELPLFDRDFDSFLPTERNGDRSGLRGLIEENGEPSAAIAALATPDDDLATSDDATEPADDDANAELIDGGEERGKKTGAKPGRVRAKSAGAGGRRKATKDE